MQQYFDADYSGPAFELFGTGHLIYFGVIVAVILYLFRGRRTWNDDMKRRGRLGLAAAIVIVELSWHAWAVSQGIWSLQLSLPLHACSVGLWTSVYILLTRNYRAYEIIFFIGIAGATQALLTPNAGDYGLPHFRALQTMTSHSLLVIAMVWMTVIEGLRPTWKSIWRTMVAANLYMVFVTAVNVLLGSNYMYTLAKPPEASVLDVMGPWPWYLFYAEFLALALFTLLYLPFALADRQADRRIVDTA
jgi:hypothetical integral membrane protein (TIGR02206 family)